MVTKLSVVFGGTERVPTMPLFDMSQMPAKSRPIGEFVGGGATVPKSSGPPVRVKVTVAARESPVRKLIRLPEVSAGAPMSRVPTRGAVIGQPLATGVVLGRWSL